MSSANTHMMQAPFPTVPESLLTAYENKLCSYDYACQLVASGYRQAAHACIWAPCNKSTSFGTYRAAVMMHLRFDGTFGFPGGLIEKNEDVILGLQRELKEEIKFSATRMRSITQADYHNTMYSSKRRLVLHFFVVKLELAQFEELERRAVCAREYGKEVYGTVRVPLYTMVDGFGGFPAFLTNQFVGSAKEQLLLALYSCKIISDEEIKRLLELSCSCT